MQTSGIVYAQEPELRISPLRTKLNLNPGESTVGSIKLKNLMEDPVTVNLDVENFKPINENYDYNFEKTETINWIRLPDKLVYLDSNQEQSVSYSVSVPVTASPGGYYFSVFASMERLNSSKNVREIKRLATLLYLEVGGDIIKDAELTRIDIPKFSFSSVVPIAVRITNKGNSHIDSDIVVTATNFNRVSELRLKGLILPGAPRKLDGNVNLSSLPGIYKFTTRFSATGEAPQENIRFVVFMPIWLLAIISLMIIAIIAKIYLFVKKRH